MSQRNTKFRSELNYLADFLYFACCGHTERLVHNIYIIDRVRVQSCLNSNSNGALERNPQADLFHKSMSLVLELPAVHTLFWKVWSWWKTPTGADVEGNKDLKWPWIKKESKHQQKGRWLNQTAFKGWGLQVTFTGSRMFPQVTVLCKYNSLSKIWQLSRCSRIGWALLEKL